MDKKLLGLIVVGIAVINLYWSAKIFSLMSYTGDPAEVELRKKLAKKYSFFSKLSYFAVLIVVALFFILGGI